MKIVFYTTSFFPYLCGVTTAVLNLSLGLIKKGHQITICVPKAKSPVLNKVRKTGIEIVSLPSFKTKIYKDVNIGAPSANSFIRIKKINPDIIHFHTPDLVGMEAILTAKLLKKPLVGTFHTYFMSPEYQKIVKLSHWGEDFIEKVLWKYSNSIYNRCDLIITPSFFAKKDLERQGIKKEIKIIHNSVNLDLVKKTSLNKITDFKSRYSLSNKTIIYVGRTSREKSLDILLLAFNQVVRKEPEAKLLIIGEGPALGGLKELSKALGLEKKVIFTGKIDHQKLLQSGAYEIASLFATASTSEVQPMSVLEAIAFGLPIVGVKARGMEELIRGNGILFNPGDINGLSKGMIKILRNESLREKFSQRSKGLIKKEYLLDNIIEKLEKAYKDLLQ
ncbi:hypothetical protein COT75_04835 [Candidatus Beckwithbacteria bacterium CG10_big_fil_rev_8_21_14_0_10_34_10]|uniref:Glycosyltransferase family 4 protein n=1 Tax=Candidatus Beckwithbacteria bacterium CG10_big_fil_rev_8_21_14_0_10_34_10 TaxID=1974495 RepID=A0A2H0WA42_9BACT|nr:MAG: hypothetical protein COT75_04835 [Candidatus Beckwithbacteria bacterium CG10_big_fil_rev_8_21_14_0_10_34_10]